ncbi:hypothetical protein [Thiomonas sp. FB-6]|uniref:hypothetical protein n=1 Tax=Thiomonas sp. FB-6 TaxID=1158291 RepID=UPI0003658FCE|nr:hypothetical protein [Thiomonas sp. FB-6]
MAAIGTLGPIGAFAGPAGLAAAPLAAPSTAPAASSSGAGQAPAAAPAAGPSPSFHGPRMSGAMRDGLDALEALAILALLSGNHRNHGADALGAMVVTLALNAYTGVQALGANPAVGAPAPGAGLNLRA